MTYYPDTDPWAEEEAAETARMDADIEMADMNAFADALARARQRGVCTHGTAVGYAPKGQRCYPEDQDGLKPGQSRCTAGCRRVFGSDEEWQAAIDAAAYGER